MIDRDLVYVVSERDGTERLISDADILALAAALPGVQVFDTPRPTSGPWLKPGRYLIAPYDKEDEE